MSPSFLYAEMENVYVYRNDDGYFLDCCLIVGSGRIDSVCIVNDDVIVVSSKCYINIISLSTKTCLWRCLVEDMYVTTITAHADGRIAVGSNRGATCAVITHPENVRS